MDLIQTQRETRELMVNVQYINKAYAKETYPEFDSAWGKMRTISARKAQICSCCNRTIQYMDPMSVYLSVSYEDGLFHRHNMCVDCITKERKRTAQFIAEKTNQNIKNESILDTIHIRHMDLEQGEKVAAQMRKDAVFINSNIPSNIVARDGLYLYDKIQAVTTDTKQYCYRCSAIIRPEETTFTIPGKIKQMQRNSRQFICQNCATKSLTASQKRIEQHKREQLL